MAASELGVKVANEALRVRPPELGASRECAEYKLFKFGVEAVAMPDFLGVRDRVLCLCGKERVVDVEVMVGNQESVWIGNG